VKRPRRHFSPVVDGAREGLSGLFRRCSADLHAYLRRRLRGSPDTADLTQEVFERFLRGDRDARARDPRAYLFGIASNVIADAKMAKERDVVVYDSGVVEEAGKTLPSEDAQGTRAVALEDELLIVLDQLPDAHRAAILLTKRDGLSCKEAAVRMRTTEGSVRVYVCEARAQIKLLLKKGQLRGKARHKNGVNHASTETD
jgi:RNA polymerase sigma-70 factor (ECF subfamily)